jgi:putative flippase GtrA
MKKTLIFAHYLYHHSFVRYVAIGGTTFILDFSLLYSLHGRLHVGLAIATSVGYWVGIIYNFLLNRSWTFSTGDKKNLRKHLLLYAALLAVNYTFTIAFVGIASHRINYLLAKGLAVIIQMSWTYFVYKNIIFASHDSMHTQSVSNS